jgi:hypothetical protein
MAVDATTASRRSVSANAGLLLDPSARQSALRGGHHRIELFELDTFGRELGGEHDGPDRVLA